MLLTVYFIAAALLTLLGIASAYNFWRYRFKGDQTIALITVFTVAFGLNILFTVTLFDYSAAETRPEQANTFPFSP